jgi:RimJ/RimL family protein N-acetyltransferase
MRRMGGDPEVMRYILGVVERPEDTAVWIDRVEERWRAQGHAWWALVHDGDVVGAATLQRLAGEPNAPFEIGWRLPRLCQKRGYAREAARAILEHARRLGISQVLAVANPENKASIAVMEAVGMTSVGLQTHYQQTVATYAWSAA